MKPANVFRPLVIPLASISAIFLLGTYFTQSWEHGVQEALGPVASTTLSSHRLRWSPLPTEPAERVRVQQAACDVLPWPHSGGAQPNGWEKACNNEQYCVFIFRNACVTRSDEGTKDRTKDKWLVEVGEGCSIPEGLGIECDLESGPSAHKIKIIHPEKERHVDPGPSGFDPVPTTFLDRSDGQPGNFYHDTTMAFYPLYVNMVLRGWDDYLGRRIAVIDAHGLPNNRKGFNEFYYAYNQSESTDWADFTDRKCFAELTFIRTKFSWNCEDHRVVPSPALNGYASFIAKHLGVSPEPARLPVTPSLFFLYRDGSTGRKLNNWEELAGSLDIPYKVHNASQSWKEQIEQVRNSSIIFGLHGAGHSLLLHAPIGAVIIEVYSTGRQDPRMFRNQAVSSGRFYIKHIVRDEKAIHRFCPFEVPMNHSITYHYANLELSVTDFHMLLDTAIQILTFQNQVPYYSMKGF